MDLFGLLGPAAERQQDGSEQGDKRGGAGFGNQGEIKPTEREHFLIGFGAAKRRYADT